MINKENFQNTAHQGREKQSAKAYLRFLESKGATTRMLYLRSRFLDDFMLNLVGQVQTRKAYAAALTVTLETISGEDKQLALHTSREFFPFWMNDVKAIAKFEHTYGFVTEAMQWQPEHNALDSLTKQANQETLSVKENDILVGFSETLETKGFDKNKIDKHTRLAKIILICLRDAPNNNHMVYRAAADAMLPLFKSNAVKKTYLDVTRTFYPTWKNKMDSGSL